MHFTYLLENPDLDSRKIGITSDIDRRLLSFPDYIVTGKQIGRAHV